MTEKKVVHRSRTAGIAALISAGRLPGHQDCVKEVVHGSSLQRVGGRWFDRVTEHPDFKLEDHAGGVPPPKKRLRLLPRNERDFQSDGRISVLRSSLSVLIYLADPFHTLVVIRTHCLIGFICVVYVSQWLSFAGFWLAVAKNGDCGLTLTTYRQAFYLALETLTTIGYGVDDQYFNNCPDAAFVLSLGAFGAMFLDTGLLGLLVLRLSMSSNRTKSVIFTDLALLQVDDEGKVSLQCRAFGMNETNLLQCSLQGYAVIQRKAGPPVEVDTAPLCISVPDMDTTNGPLFMGLPVTIKHEIDEESPLAPPGLDRAPTVEELKKHLCELQHLEVVFVLGGAVEHTGNTAEKRHSYTLDDIVWNRRFVDCLQVTKEGAHRVDFSALHMTVRCETIPTRAPVANSKPIDTKEVLLIETGEKPLMEDKATTCALDDI